MIALVLNELLDAAIVMLIVLGSCALGFLQEFNGSRAVEELRERLALSVTVLRDGARLSLPVIQLVPGDVVELCAGNLVPADGRILSARDFFRGGTHGRVVPRREVGRNRPGRCATRGAQQLRVPRNLRP